MDVAQTGERVRLSAEVLSRDVVRLCHVLDEGVSTGCATFAIVRNGALLSRERLAKRYWPQLGVGIIAFVCGFTLLMESWISLHRVPDLTSIEGKWALVGSLVLLWYGHYYFRGKSFALKHPKASISDGLGSNPEAMGPYLIRKHLVVFVTPWGSKLQQYVMVAYASSSWFVLASARSAEELEMVAMGLPDEVRAGDAPWGPVLLPRLFKLI